MHFDDNKLYRASDPEVTDILPYSTLASYRHEGRGPEYIKLGSRVLYQGRVLNEWLTARIVKPKAA